MDKLNILLLCDKPVNNANTIVDHIDAFSLYSKHNIFELSHKGDIPEFLDLERFDAIIIHYSLYIIGEGYLSTQAKRRIRRYKGLKIQFIQDEYRNVNRITNMIQFLGIDLLFTCVPESEWSKVYGKLLGKVILVNNLTGYVPENLIGKKVPKISERSIDVGYRARKLPYWYGELAVEKWKIVDDFEAHAKGSDLKYDISHNEEDRIYGPDWVEFLSSCKATLGVESGASVFDFTGKLQEKVERHQKHYPQDSFQKVRDQYFPELDGKIRLNQISPRTFESIALKTALVMFEGEYSDVVKPGVHYFSLKKDFSNFDELKVFLKDDQKIQEMVDKAYQDIIVSGEWSYAKFIDSVVDPSISEGFASRSLRAKNATFDQEEFSLVAKHVCQTPRAFYFTDGFIGSIHDGGLWQGAKYINRFARQKRNEYVEKLVAPVLLKTYDSLPEEAKEFGKKCFPELIKRKFRRFTY